MPWNERNLMTLRSEFVVLAAQPDANFSALCRRYGISRKTGYTWCAREGAVREHSRRPHHSPRRTLEAVEAAVLAVRDRFPDWGARKLKRYLLNRGQPDLPAVSTITAILHRHGRIRAEASVAAQPWQRFEHAAPNALWQMDFKGHVPMRTGRCHPLTVLDDHSRFNLLLHACSGEGLDDVQAPLEACFRRYGLPERISCDNGPPWGTMWRKDGLTRLGAWLIRLGVRLSHAAPLHPQTNGKNERFHRTLNAGLLRSTALRDLAHAQRAFDAFRQVYNHHRPHQAIGLDVPIARYRPSPRAFPATLPPIHYDPAWTVRKVDRNGRIHFKGRRLRISHALHALPVALAPDGLNDGRFLVYFCQQPIGAIDLNASDSTD